MTTPTLTAVTYGRTASSDDQTAGLARQRARCEELAEAMDARIVATFTDAGYAGGTVDRPGLHDLLAHLGRERVDVVIAADPERLASDRRLLTELDWQIEMTGATLVTDEPGFARSYEEAA